MISEKFDLIILGGGPIASIVGYFLSQEKEKLNLNRIALIQKEPNQENYTAYLNAGGSIRYYFFDEELKQATKETYDFIKNLVNLGVDLNLIEDYYHFVHRGIFVPSLNISGKKLVEYLKQKMMENGVLIFNETEFLGYEKKESEYLIKTTKGDFLAKFVVAAMGYKNKEYFKAPLEIEKRQLFVLDLRLNEDQLKLPHTVIKFKEGIVYYFLKKFDDGYKLVLGQEDIFEHSLTPEPENYFNELINMGLSEILPFLKEAKVEKILWGYDVENKKPLYYKINQNFWLINCGSAVRSLHYIGRKFLNEFSLFRD